MDRIEKGYHGTVSSRQYKNIWQHELKKNPELFKTLIISKHNTSEEAANKEYLFQKNIKVIDNPLYINQSCWPNFKTPGRKPGSIPWNKGKIFVIREKKIPLKGRTYEEIYGLKKAQEIRKKHSQSMKGNKNLKGYQNNRKGSRWYTNTIEDRMFLPGDIIPEKFFPGRSKNVKRYKLEVVPIIIQEI